jgi:hypothetical protein
MDLKGWADTVKNFAQVFAWLAAGLYFIVKFFAGFSLFDLSLEIACQRDPVPDSTLEDYLAISVTMKKGPNAALRLHDARIVLKFTDSRKQPPEQVLEFSPDINRLFVDTSGPRLVVSNRPEPALPYTLSPGESTTLAVCAKVARDAACGVEVVVVGTPTLNRSRGQWRASAISLPGPPPPNAVPALAPASQRP